MEEKSLKPPAFGEWRIPESVKILDLSAVPTRTQNMAPARIVIPYTGYKGFSTTLGAEEVQGVAKARKLESPNPVSMALIPVEGESSTLLGIPTMESNPAYLELEWIDQGRRFRSNFMALLQAKRIRIPQGTKLAISLASVEDPKLGPCVQLSWAGDCFIPIQPEPDDEEKSDT